MTDNKDHYENYNHQRYAHFRHVRVGGYNVQKVKGGERLIPKTEKRKIPFEEVKSLRLDEVGTLAPPLDTEDFTIVSNYLLDFWGACIGSDAVLLYLHLKRYAYGKKDFCYIDIDTLMLKMKKKRTAVTEYLKILEEHHFIAKFNRYDVEEKKEVSPLFKLRRHIPLITDEMYQSLPSKLQEEHDRFMKEYNGLTLTNQITEQHTAVSEMVVGKEIIANKKQREESKDRMEHKESNHEYSLAHVSDKERELNQLFHEILMKKTSKPTYETWFKYTILLEEDYVYGRIWNIYCPTEHVRERLEDSYREFVARLLSNSHDIYFNEADTLKFTLIDSLVEKIIKRAK